jgi:IS605 OrfB family transposase
MKLIRSTKCSLKFSTKKKVLELTTILNEYGKVVNIFIQYFWLNPDKASKVLLLKDIVDIPETWLSARLRKVAAREAIDMVLATKTRWKDKPDKMVIPVHKGQRMYVSCTIADLVSTKNNGYKTEESRLFDAWLHIASVGNKMIMDLPIKYHKHFNKYNNIGKRLNSYIITKNYVQFSFEIVTETKKEGLKCIGIDTGINALASLNNGNQYGLDIKGCIERVKRCKQKSNGYYVAKRALKQRIDETAKEILVKETPDLIVVEQLKNMGYKTKLKARLSKSIRASIGTWNWKYWLKRLEMQCELNRVSFRTVSPYYTSTTCPVCGQTNRGNRNGEKFLCQNCGHADNADINAGKNILNRFLTGQYGARYKQENQENLVLTNFL